MKRVFIIDEKFRWQFLKNDIVGNSEAPEWTEDENKGRRFHPAEIPDIKKTLEGLGFKRVSTPKVEQ